MYDIMMTFHLTFPTQSIGSKTYDIRISKIVDSDISGVEKLISASAYDIITKSYYTYVKDDVPTSIFDWIKYLAMIFDATEVTLNSVDPYSTLLIGYFTNIDEFET